MKCYRHPILALCSTLLLAACSDAGTPAPPGNVAGASNAGGSPMGASGAAGAVSAGGASGAGVAGAAPGAGAAGSSGGALGVAGAAGAGVAGSSGSSSAGGSGPVGGGIKSGKSAGCGKDVTGGDQPNQYKAHDMMVGGKARRYWTKLPANYSKDMAYPIAFYGPGCGLGSQNNPEPTVLDSSAKDKAIIVFLAYNAPSTGCFETGIENSPEPAYFGQALDEIQAGYCTDKSKVFVSGYSSGGWLSNLLACTHGDRIRAIATVAGGLTPQLPANCKGTVAGISYAGTQDTANPISKIDDKTGKNTGSGAARDRLLMLNQCGTETTAWDPMWPFCKLYNKCKSGYPVVWCEENAGHSKGGTVSEQGFWKFFSSLPAATD